MNLFKSNVGKVDRIIRVVLGILLVTNVFVGLGSPIGWVGIILILTGAFGVCPIYALLNMDTRTAGEKIGLK